MANTMGQITVSGTVFDSSKLYVVPGVIVHNTSGADSITDTLGIYHIKASESDSISFFYNGKSTMKFPVKAMKNYTSFDISLHIKTENKYKVLNPVTVYTNSYQMDSLENRQNYSNIFGEGSSGIRSTYDPEGAAGLDLDALIGMFQFRKNKQNLAFKNRLINEEQERYIDYRFSSRTIQRVTGLKGAALEKYKKLYRPSYFFVVNSTLAQFYQYILTTSYAFKNRERDN
jgi:hypothetical protein